VEPPTGTVALLFTDIEGSTVLAGTLGADWPELLSAHHAVVGGAIAAHGGYVDRTEGDGFFALFPDPRAAVAAAVAAQHELRARRWPTPSGQLRVRMGLHAGHVARRATGYVGLEIHRAARVSAAAHGGQTLLTEAIMALARGAVPTDDLGEHRLKDFPLPERLFCAVVDGEGAAAFPPPRTLTVRPTNLPADDRLLLGREAELAAIAAAFANGHRLLTVTGMGGSGKTRLAIAAGGALLDTHPGGVWWVPLAAATADDALLSGLAGALRVRDDGVRPVAEAIAARIGDRPTLAVVDNLEHLAMAGPQLAELLAAAPGLRVLATSRLPLRVAAEHVLALAPLPAPASVDLLRRLAARVRPDLRLDDTIAGELCERLDHLPLAIELAAARLAVLAPEQLRDRLASPLVLLRGGGPDTPERQRSLRATIEWTLGLLDPAAQELFRRLGVFAGPVELEDIEAVCGDDAIDGVAALLDAGLLRRIEDGSGTVRFRLPEPLRQIAVERLDAGPDRDRLRRAHAAHVARAAWPGSFRFISTVAEVARTTALQRDVLAALAWSRTHDRGLAQSLATGRAGWLDNAGPVAEPLALVREVLAAGDATPEVEARALFLRGGFHRLFGDKEMWAEHAERSAALLGIGQDSRIVALADLATARAFGASGDARAAEAAVNDEAERYGSARGRAMAAFARAQVSLRLGDPAAAAAALDVAADLTAAGDLTIAGWIDTVRADVHLALGEHQEAARLYVRSMDTAWAAGEVGQLYLDLNTTSVALAGAGRAEAALEVHAMASVHGEEIGTGAGVVADVVSHEPIRAAAEALPAEVAAAALARGRAVPLEQRIDRVRALVAQAPAATREG
jgi:predicted ATPase/class 3 adenylate cyclase